MITTINGVLAAAVATGGTFTVPYVPAAAPDGSKGYELIIATTHPTGTGLATQA